ncbi:MAG TPA: biopolymer transporter ExbD [Candidatus Binataceae bacterium]|nr:biopolymer transporter ExbD [Candidatus Binataceae bacterium]
MAIQTGGDQGGIFATINITPLTDIFLVLLIIFMVATAVTIESAAHVDLPRLEAPTQHQQPKGVTVTYTSDHQIFVNGHHVSEGELRPAVHDALSQSTDKTVVFDGDPSVILGDMVRILDIAKTAGADQIALAVSGGGSGGGESAQMPAPPSAAPMPEPIEPGAEPVAPSNE